jgi:rhodanese-related sulfurtransferase
VDFSFSRQIKEENKMKRLSVYILAVVTILAVVVAGCAPVSAPTYVDLSPEEAKALIDSTPDLVIIDVSPNYDQGRIPGAINYYLGDGSLDDAIPTLDKTKTYLVYCHVDSVSIAGATQLIEAGFENVYRLEGNYAAWVDAGYPVEK